MHKSILYFHRFQMNKNTLTNTCIMKNMAEEFVQIMLEYDPATMDVLSSLDGFRFLTKEEMCEFLTKEFPLLNRTGMDIEESIVYSFFGLYIKSNPYFNTAYETCATLCKGEEK